MKTILLIGLLLSAIFSNAQKIHPRKEIGKLVSAVPSKNKNGKTIKNVYDICLKTNGNDSVLIVKNYATHIMREPNWCSFYIIEYNKKGNVRLTAIRNNE